MLYAITLERRGIPTAAVGVKKLVETTGRGMCRAQGIPEYPIATIDDATGSLVSLHDAATGVRFLAGLPAFLRRTVASAEARAPSSAR